MPAESVEFLYPLGATAHVRTDPTRQGNIIGRGEFVDTESPLPASYIAYQIEFPPSAPGEDPAVEWHREADIDTEHTSPAPVDKGEGIEVRRTTR